MGLIAVVVAGVVASPAKLWRPHDVLRSIENPQIGEAISWWQGRLDLPARHWDSALVEKRTDGSIVEHRPDGAAARAIDGPNPIPDDGRALDRSARDARSEPDTRPFVYSPFPPLFTVLAAAFVPFFSGVPHLGIVLLIALPIPLLAYRLFLNRTHSALGAAVLTFGLVMGTSLWPVLEKTIRGGSPYFVNPALGVVGQLIFLGEFAGRRRPWPAAAGVVIAALSRQLTTAYLLPLAWMIWRGRGSDPASSDSGRLGDSSNVPDLVSNREDSRTRLRTSVGRASPFVVAMIGAVGVPMVLNTLKFDSPLESGYRFIYRDRPEDHFTRDTERYGIFSPHFVPRNLYYMHVGPPELHTIRLEGRNVWRLRPSDWGTGIWWTSPLLLFLFPRFARILSNPAERLLLGASGLVAGTLLFYHCTGFHQHGFNRYSLDFVPALYFLAAGRGLQGAGRIGKLLAITWGVVYFGWIL